MNPQDKIIKMQMFADLSLVLSRVSQSKQVTDTEIGIVLGSLLGSAEKIGLNPMEVLAIAHQIDCVESQESEVTKHE